MAKAKNTDKGVLSILKGSTKFKTDVSLITFRFEPKFLVKLLSEIAEDVENGRVIQISQGTSAIVMICSENAADMYERKYKKYVISHKKDLAALVLISPKKIVDTPGVLEFVLNRFAKNKLNIVEMIGCYTDTTFVIEKKYLFKALDLLGEFGV
jgi:aspartokinase